MKKIYTYLGITFAASWAVWGLLALTGRSITSDLIAQGVVAITMWFPGLGALLTKRIYQSERLMECGFRPQIRRNLGTYLTALLFPTVFMAIGGALYFGAFPGQFDPSLSAVSATIPEGFTPATMILLSLVSSLVAGVSINMVFGLGEEIGWRGFLFPEMRKHMSDRRAVLVCGVIWGLWHAPITCMGHNYGTQYPGYPIVGILCMCVFCTSLGIILSHFTSKTDTIWPAAIGHGAVNAIVGLPMLLQDPGFESFRPLGPAFTGILAGVPLMGYAAYLLRTKYR